MKNKGRSKRLIAACLSAMLLLGGMSTVWAANDAIAPDTGSLTIHKYVMPDTSQAALPNDGNAAGTGTNPAVPATATPLGDITFKLYKVTTPNNNFNIGKGPYTVNTTDNTVTDKDGHSFPIGAATPAEVTTSATDDAAKGTATASNLTKGVYLVVEQNSNLVDEPAAPFVVSVPMTNKDGNGWITDVHAYPKNEKLTIDKKVNGKDNDNLAIGKEAEWTIMAHLPQNLYKSDTDNITYSISDTLDGALTYVNRTDKEVTVKLFKDDKTTEVTSVPLSKDRDYILTEPSDTSQEVKVELTATGRQKVQNAYNDTTDPARYIQVTINTIVNEKILTKNPAHTLTNNAEYGFTNQFGEEKTGNDEDPPTVTNGKIILDKVDGNNATTKLPDAQFKIASTNDKATAGTYLKAVKKADDIIVAILDVDEIYTDADGNTVTYAGVVSGGGYTIDDYEVTTDTNGAAAFDGLKHQDATSAALKYYLVETKAPRGYNLIGQPVEVEFKNGENITQEITVVVKNSTGFTLPNTGAYGSIILTVVGIALIGTAIVLVVTRKKSTHR